MFIPGIMFYEVGGRYHYRMYGLFGGGSSGVCDDPDRQVQVFLALYSGVRKTRKRTCNLKGLCAKYKLSHSHVQEFIKKGGS